MKQKCLALFIIVVLMYASVPLFSGCTKKIERSISINGVEYSDDSEEFTLEETIVTSDKKGREEQYQAAESAHFKAEEARAFARMNMHSFQAKSGEPALEDTTPGTELWIIEKTSAAVEEEQKMESPRLMAVLPEDKKEIILPLESTSVNARVSGYIATVDILQKYHNPYDSKIEAVYVFPLPQSAAVTDFIMIIGDRKIRGLVREKEEAKRIYEEAKDQGYHASILTQERPNIFKQKVANIEPGKRIDISITFFNPLHFRDGEFEFVFPTVVGPRFNPPGQTDGIGAVGRGTHNESGQSTNVPYLRPDEKSAHDISITVDIDAGVSIEKIYSHTHVIDVDRKTPSHAIVRLSQNDRVPDKDFVLRYRTSGKEVKTAMMFHKGEEGDYFSLLLQPPEDLRNLPRMPREMVFVLDCSGSMHGVPIAKAKNAISRALRNLDSNDTFQIIRFSEKASSLGRYPVPATPENVEKGLKYLDSLNSGGGTMMIEGIRAALDFPHDEKRLRIVSFMTDGYIGNEYEILAAIHKKLGQSRIFSFGVGSSVNRYLLERMAVMGRGAVAYVGLDESAGEAVDRFYDAATRPAMTDIDIDWGGLEVIDVYPKSIPDLFVGRPVMITGRIKKNVPARICVNGRKGDKNAVFYVAVDLNNSDGTHSGIRSVWARWKLADLSNMETYAPGEKIRKEIIETSINFNLISRYTAFLAVDSLERTKGDHGYTVDIPVPVPDGVRYETTVD